MSFNHKNLYHPFNESYLGFFIMDKNPNENAMHYILEDIDLYVQPVEEPVTAIVLVIIRVIWLLMTETIFFKLYKMANNENGLLKEVTCLYALTMMITAPIGMVSSLLRIG